MRDFLFNFMLYTHKRNLVRFELRKEYILIFFSWWAGKSWCKQGEKFTENWHFD